jgi:hypothetical protein
MYAFSGVTPADFAGVGTDLQMFFAPPSRWMHHHITISLELFAPRGANNTSKMQNPHHTTSQNCRPANTSPILLIPQ